MLKLYLIIGNAFLVIVIPLVIILTKTISRPLRELTEVADRFSKGDLDLKVPGLGRHDEIGNLAKALDRLGTSTRLAMERLKRK